MKVIAKKVLSGNCDHCNMVTSLHMVVMDDGSKALLCRHCIPKEDYPL